MTLRTTCMAVAMVSALGGMATAATIAYEDFDLPAGSDSIAGSAGGGSLGFSNSWTSINAQPSGGNVISPGYGYDSLITAGNRAQVFNAAATGDTTPAYFYRTLSTPFSVAANSSGSVWASFMIQGTAAAAGGLSAVIGFASAPAPAMNDTSMVTIGAIGGNTNYRVAHRALDTSGGGVVQTTGTSAGTLVFAVVKLNFDTNPGAAETLSLWLNPDLGGFDGTEGSLGTAALSNVSLSNMGISGIGSIAFGSNYVGTQNPTLGLDEIRLGTSLSDVVVVPEPSVVGAMLAGVVLAAGTRRRTRR